MEEKKTIAILGITGTQGGSVARKFLSLSDPPWTVRGITRSLTSPAALSLSASGVDLVQADIDSPSSLIAAFAGAHAIFAVTDFWAPYFSSFGELSQISDRATGEHAFAIEVRRGKNIVDAAAAAGGRLERFVWSTLPSFKELSRGKYGFAFHFDSKAVVAGYLRGKEGGGLWERSSLLNMGFYTDNMIKYGGFMGAAKVCFLFFFFLDFWGRKAKGKQDMEDGKYILRKPGKNDAIHPFVVTGDTGEFVELLVRAPPKQNLLGVSEMSDYVTYMKIWTEVTGVPSEVREITVEEADKAAPGGIGREAAESTATSAEFGWGKDLVMPKDLDPNIKLTSLRSYIENEDWEIFLSKI
ncbi:NAD(P)-binding protein [Mollisia scopiformis]|uniref:NAD(P)-binding protein n=1 Tax=Mollisia scopiformis TaxID=149040 RepID=A0A194X6P1_MOLSC|nr:NAD(P)-binding protein [Mollisia scopiformis]KUJ15850.1 NAD(P)-binding protein [Mollisia scopiformis]